MQKADLIIIGSGPGGYRAAEYAAKKGRFLKEEAEAYLGELNSYCRNVTIRAENGSLSRSEDYVMREFSDPVYVAEYLDGIKNKWKELFC